MGFLLFLTLLLAFCSRFVLRAAKGDPFYRAQQSFANAHNEWANAVKHLSPASPDYESRLRAEWLKRDIGQKFRALEQSFE